MTLRNPFLLLSIVGIWLSLGGLGLPDGARSTVPQQASEASRGLLSLADSLEQEGAKGPAPAAEQAPPAFSPELLARLCDLMLEGIDTKKPNANLLRRVARNGDASAFDGSYDWHSCLFAHWSLLVVARTTANEDLEAELRARLTREILQGERELLAAADVQRLPTYPYGHGWLALVLNELARRDAFTADEDLAWLAEFRTELEQLILGYLEANEFPEPDPRGRRKGHPFVGSYRSWIFTWVLLSWTDPVGDDVTQRLRALFDEHIAPQREALAAYVDPHPYDFLWMPSVLALVEDVVGPPSKLSLFDPGPLNGFPAELDIRMVHVLGVELSRLWGLAAVGRRGDTDALELYEERLAEYLAEDHLWQEDFTVVTHWIPQFLFLGHWIAQGRP